MEFTDEQTDALNKMCLAIKRCIDKMSIGEYKMAERYAKAALVEVKLLTKLVKEDK